MKRLFAVLALAAFAATLMGCPGPRRHGPPPGPVPGQPGPGYAPHQPGPGYAPHQPGPGPFPPPVTHP
ncbi:hypothetical protein [Solidesulfovibrio sp.]